MRFEERELKPYAEPVTASLLKQGEAYFSVQYVDGDGHIPIVETWVFAGRKLSPEDTGDTLYFQDVESYRDGIRYDSTTGETARFQVAAEENIKHMFEYERAIEELMRCSLRRRKMAA